MRFIHSSRLLLAAGLFLGGLQSAQALYIPAKAALGQWLLARAWQQQLDGADSVRPWPWADTHPLAMLEFPRLGQRQVVLAGQSDRALAWGPVAANVSGGDDWIISGHRDTHFRWLGKVQRGDALYLQTPQGHQRFSVIGIEVVDSRTRELVDQPGRQQLTLVTCWPLEAAASGGPLRLVVHAEVREDLLRGS